MTRQPADTYKGVLAATLLLMGCVGTDEALHYLGKSDLYYYKDVAQEIDYPDVESETRQQALATEPPRTLAARRQDKPREMTLMEAIQTALANNGVIRNNAQFLSGGNTLLNDPDATPSVYDPAIQETGILFGRRGVEAALADFDTTFSTSMIWGRSETVQNNVFFGGGVAPGATLQQDTGNFRSSLNKQFGDGGRVTLANDWDFRFANIPGQLFPSTFTGNVRAEYRRPLWAASGTEFNRIAGPQQPNLGGVTGVSQGVVIARINNDISIADFEASVRNLVKDVEDLYWQLYLRYHQYHTRVVERESTLRSWDKIKNDPNARAQDEPQARDTYFAARAAAEAALSDLFTTETRLRRLLGLPVNDGTVIKPADEPTMGQILPDWRVSLTEALTRRVELRRQKWNIKSLELQLKAAKSLTNPRLDFLGTYQVNGFGDNLFGENDDDEAGTAQGFDSAFETITQGNQTAWNLGFEFSMPLGFRSARAQVRNLELRLLKARQVLAAQELEISHELAVAFQNVARHYENTKSNYERIPAARELVRILSVQRGLGLATADELLRAQNNLADAELSFYTSLVQYNQALADLQFRKGTLLEYNSIFLAESDWDPQAYEQALRRAWARSHAVEHHKWLHTEPDEFVPFSQTPALPIDKHPVDKPFSDPNSTPEPSLSQPPPLPPDQFRNAPPSGNVPRVPPHPGDDASDQTP